MKIVLYDCKKNLNFETVEWDKCIDIKEKNSYLYEKNIINNQFLKFMDFLLDEIDIKEKNELYYYGENQRVWMYILLFSYISENLKLFYKKDEIKESGILKLDLKNVGFHPKDIKKEISYKEFEEFPDYVKNLYYREEERIVLSKIGEVYVDNIRD